MAYPTGRTRTLTFEGTFSGEMTYSWDGFLAGDGYNQNFYITVDAFTGTPAGHIRRDFGFTIASNESNYGTGHSLAGTEVTYSAQMGSFGDGGPGTMVSGSIPFDTWGLDHMSGGKSVVGTYRFSVEVEEYFELTEIPVGPEYLDDGYPKWGDDGQPYFRGMPASAIRFFEKVPVGAATSLTVSATGLDINLSSTTIYSFEILRGNIVTASCEGLAFGTSLPSGTCYVTTPEGYDHTLNYSANGVTNSATSSNGASCSYSGVLGGYIVDSVQNYAYISRGYIEPTKYKWHLKNYSYGVPMTLPITWKLYDEDESSASTELPVTGSATKNVTQYYERININISGNIIPPDAGGTEIISFDNISYCGARIQGSSLASINEDTHNWRPWIHGKAYSAFDIEHTQAYPLAIGGTWAISGGEDGITATKSFAEYQFAEGYRYLRLRVRRTSSSTVPFVFAIDGRTWRLSAEDADWAYVYVDLCRASNDTWTTDTCSTRWPVDWDYSDGGSPGFPNSTTPAWGINQFNSLTVTLSPNVSIDISEIALYRNSFCEASFVADLSPEKDLWQVEDESETSGWTNIYSTTDGRCFDLPDQYHVKPISGPEFYYYTHYTIAQMASLFETTFGFNTTYGGAYGYPDEYHTEERNGFFIGGAGYIANYSGSTVTWQVQDHVSLIDSTIKAQPLYDWVKVYPGAGDVFGGGGYDIPTPLATHWHGHGRVQGIDYNKSLPKSGATISSSPDVGDATTSAIGTYFTDGTYPRQGQSVTWSASNSTVPVAGAHYDGGEMRICWASGLSSKGISYDTSDAMRHYLAYIKEDDRIWIKRADNLIPFTWTESDTTFDAQAVCVRVDRRSTKQTLYLAYAIDSSIKLASSLDEGRTWTMPETIAIGTFPAFVISRSGTRYFYWIDGTTIKGQIRSPQNDILIPTFTAIATIDEDSGIAVDESYSSQGALRITLVYVQGGTTKTQTAPDGKTFA